MSHHEKLRRMNAELNTPEAWARRWQVEREENERRGYRPNNYNDTDGE